MRIPIQRLSKRAFGGADLKIIYITSISDGLVEDAPRAQPFPRHLLAISNDIQGLLFRSAYSFPSSE
ncbi:MULTISPECIES: hypothetical protein [unclassified Mesorhizobium]|uniref:hypothetical protein n=1 Tax=unclassified Mesorhizobium TaxID=325217 RepID=UPI000FDB94FE|nr:MULTISPECIES: hypothetical protein [unclassified Mesorhizobium]TGQ28510.1 hypothetical protein EN859_034475 [Mesorhizobium sp. M00.F.Ca.ET.216.01.1.1]TIS54339.1 MAG: hypothetical protein E5W91_27255 [Mesorhizobium sp.]TJW03139.1 MAG: hypothetical protein E5W82_32965 [Mesorhizobium sp.]TJW43890.1 MAG: hypothetical protein E5W83_16130 [Mesorhizobium sp.]